MRGLSLEELRYLAAQARLPEKLVVDIVTETVVRVRDEWPNAKKALPIARPRTTMASCCALGEEAGPVQSRRRRFAATEHDANVWTKSRAKFVTIGTLVRILFCILGRL